MGTFNNLKLKNIETKRFALGIITLLTLAISVLVIIAMIVDAGISDSLLIIAFIVILNMFIVFKYYPFFKNKMELRDIDVKIFKLSYSFLTHLKYENKEEKLKQLFSAHLESEILSLYTKCTVDDINYITVCKELSKYKTDVKYFAIYTLLDIAAEDKIYSLQEDEFIEDVRLLLKIHKISFQTIKNSYIKQGLKEERKILEEARRKTAKEITKTFLPYEAFKILGVLPSVTKRQLKKVYRTLAKKYHPDKFHGQNEDIINKMEDKFQELTVAYEIVKKYKKF